MVKKKKKKFEHVIKMNAYIANSIHLSLDPVVYKSMSLIIFISGETSPPF